MYIDIFIFVCLLCTGLPTVIYVTNKWTCPLHLIMYIYLHIYIQSCMYPNNQIIVLSIPEKIEGSKDPIHLPKLLYSTPLKDVILSAFIRPLSPANYTSASSHLMAQYTSACPLHSYHSLSFLLEIVRYENSWILPYFLSFSLILSL